jgi:hypothetical protein
MDDLRLVALLRSESTIGGGVLVVASSAHIDHGARSTKKKPAESRLRGKRAHTETMVLGQLKKSQQNRATAFESRQITAKRFVGPWNLPDQLIGCSGLCPLDSISLNTSTERAQGHFLSPWSKSGALYTKEPRHSLCMYQCGSRKPTAGVSNKLPTSS